MRPCELSYIVIEKELLAIIWSLQKLSTYLRGAKIYIEMDHQALVFLQRCKFSIGTIRRWMLLIQEFDIEIEHVRGKDNIVPDVLIHHHQHMPNVREKPGDIILALICKKKLNSKIEKFLSNNTYDKWCVIVVDVELPPYIIDVLKLGEKFNFNNRFDNSLTLNKNIDDDRTRKLRGT